MSGYNVRDEHPLAGQTVVLNLTAKEGMEDHDLYKKLQGQEYRIEDWWENLFGKSWMFAQGNPAAMIYGIRTGLCCEAPTDNEVVYGKIGGLGHLVHVSELGQVVPENNLDLSTH